jgi:hypothetical protein
VCLARLSGGSLGARIVGKSICVVEHLGLVIAVLDFPECVASRQFKVSTAQSNQLIMSTCLDDLTVFHNSNDARSSDGRKSMTEHQMIG